MYTHKLSMHLLRALASPRLATGALVTLALLSAACGDNSPTKPPITVLPTVTSTSPASAATGVPRNVSITATFSEAMNLTTINATTFTLTSGATAIPGVVTYVGTTATLTPASTLASNTTFTATVSTGAKDLQGDALATAKTWSFTTVATSLTGPAVVNLGTAANYVILAKSAVSTTGTTAVVGNVGLSPAAATFITGFALSAPPTTFTTSALVTGQEKRHSFGQ